MIEPDKAMSPELAKVWTDRANAIELKLPASLPAVDGGAPVTRGEFLPALY